MARKTVRSTEFQTWRREFEDRLADIWGDDCADIAAAAIDEEVDLVGEDVEQIDLIGMVAECRAAAELRKQGSAHG
jgi:hypothetical protein